MTVTTIRSEEARSKWRDVVDAVLTRTGEFIIQRYGKPVAVLVNHDEWSMLKRLHAEELKRRSQEQDIPWSEAEKQLMADGVIDG
ncbi:type II toxin-antitoxin system Phd/YefM family antitoxin [Chloroflexi bacterium TSY]|nr:type II toxin-antitoxin system Phd/YefM family antitoxin [Chloroflexi bacterium TSY]